ncbi:MAG TPA: GNAT family N-acetyltransferase [Gaiellaceae bacterium]|nr:GNAT family N-acetyltransferase [Gaiellaceae bacterium]
MNVERLDDAGRFLELAGPFLLEQEAANNLPLGITGTIRADDALYPERSFWIVRDGDRVAGAALRTPPYNLVLGTTEPGAVEPLAAAVDDRLPGVVGLRPSVDRFALARPAPATLEREQGVYSLERVSDVPRRGRGRPADPRDRDLLIGWWRAFSDEALHERAPDTGREEQAVDVRLGADHAGLHVWEDGGAVVSFAGWGGPTPNGIRIGPVYTPPELRGRGYATALVAELSRLLLERGRRFCFLYTDLANPTANAIYRRIGYVQVAESAEYRFE